MLRDDLCADWTLVLCCVCADWTLVFCCVCADWTVFCWEGADWTEVGLTGLFVSDWTVCC